METENKITKVTRIFQRNDGSEARIVAQVFWGMGLTESTEIYVHKRESANHEWKLCNDKPHADWLKISVDDYLKFGRSEMLQTVSHAEILKTISLLGKPMPVDEQEDESIVEHQTPSGPCP